MRTLTISLTALALLGASMAAHATSYPHNHSECIKFMDNDWIGVTLNANDKRTSNDSHKGWFNILKDGYDPSVHEIAVAKAWFLLTDDSNHDTYEWVEVDLGFGSAGYGPVEIDYNDWIGGQLKGSALFELNNNGKLKYEITITSGDVYLKKAKIVACAKHLQPQHGQVKVADGGVTGAMFGFSVLGLALFRKKGRR